MPYYVAKSVLMYTYINAVILIFFMNNVMIVVCKINLIKLM